MEIDKIGVHDWGGFHGVTGKLVPVSQKFLDLFLSGKCDRFGLHPGWLHMHFVIVEASQELPEMADDALQRVEKKPKLGRAQLGIVRPLSLDEGPKKLAQ